MKQSQNNLDIQFELKGCVETYKGEKTFGDGSQDSRFLLMLGRHKAKQIIIVIDQGKMKSVTVETSNICRTSVNVYTKI